MEMKTNSNKYVVFKTINKTNKRYYIGFYDSNLKDFSIYIGGGIYVNDPYTYQYSKTLFQQEVKAFGPKLFIKEILFESENYFEVISYYKDLLLKSVCSSQCYNNFIYPDDYMDLHLYASQGGEYVKTLTQTKNPLYYESALSGNCVKIKGKYYYLSIIKDVRYDRARKFQIQSRPVHKYNSITGEYISSYEHQEDAEYDNKYSNITKSIKFKTFDKNTFV